MTEKLNGSSIRIPLPILIVLTTLILAIFSWAVVEAARTGGDHNQIIVNTGIINNEVKPDIQKLKDTKADKIDLQRIYDQLDRIEIKLDDHMQKR